MAGYGRHAGKFFQILWGLENRKCKGPGAGKSLVMPEGRAKVTGE